jgi:hypothetical protein
MKRENLSHANFINERLQQLEKLKIVLDNHSDEKKDGFFSYWVPYPITLKSKDIEISIDNTIEGKIMKDLIVDYVINQIKLLEEEFKTL